MRLLITTDTVGGVWTFTGDLATAFLQRGHAVHLVSFSRKPSPDQQAWINRHTAPNRRHSERSEEPPYSAGSRDTAAGLAANQLSLTHSFTKVPLEWMQNNDRAFEDGQAFLLDQIETFTPDLILSNQLCFGRLDTPAPRVVVAHSDVLSWAKTCRPSALEPTPWLNRYTSVVQAGLLDAAALVVPTAWMGEALAANFHLPNHYQVIPNGAELATSTPDVSQPLTEPQRKLQAVSAGRLWDQAKGLDTLAGTDLPLPVMVAGEAQFEGEALPLLPPQVRLLGQLPPAALQGVFRESAIYLCTSHYEPFGLAPLEAALCGCALLIRDLPSLREVWGEDALYFRNAAELQTWLIRLAADPALLTQAQSRARHRATRYSVGRMAEAYLALFHSLLQPQTVRHVA